MILGEAMKLPWSATVVFVVAKFWKQIASLLPLKATDMASIIAKEVLSLSFTTAFGKVEESEETADWVFCIAGSSVL